MNRIPSRDTMLLIMDLQWCVIAWNNCAEDVEDYGQNCELAGLPPHLEGGWTGPPGRVAQGVGKAEPPSFLMFSCAGILSPQCEGVA